MSKRVLIQHIIAIWDECDHVSMRHASRLFELFLAGYQSSFPEANGTSESPAVIATKSPMFSLDRVKRFLHKGSYRDYAGQNKDLAIAKYCANGFIDQDEIYHFIVDDMRRMRFREGSPPMHSDDAVMVVFFTSDRAHGMTEAIRTVIDAHNRVNFSFLQVDKNIAGGDERTKNAGSILGYELKERFVKIENGGLLLEITNE